MEITLNIVLDCVKKYGFITPDNINKDLRFARVSPIPEAGTALIPECLYVGELADAVSFQRGSLACFICPEGDGAGAHSGQPLEGIILVKGDVTAAELFTILQNEFMRITNWAFSMYKLAFHGKSMHDILELSEGIIGNFIAIFDSALTLIAYTRNIEIDDPISLRAIRKGYHTDDTIIKFRENRRFEEWEHSTGIIIADDSADFITYPTVSRIFKFQDTYFLHVVMHCNNRPYSLALIDLFQLLLDVLAVYAENEWEKKNGCTHIYDSFLKDLIEGRIERMEAITERAKYMGIPVSGTFNVFRIRPREGDKYAIWRMDSELRGLFAASKILLYHGEIIMLNIYSRDKYKEQLQYSRTRLDAFLRKFEARAGISSFFELLTDISSASCQAVLALQYGDGFKGEHLLMDTGTKPKLAPSFLFEDYFLYCFLDSNDRNLELWKKSESRKALMRLHAHDQKNGTFTLKILYSYLIKERRATEVAAELHMHRNNVIYHIKKIEEILALDLNDSAVRMNLLSSYAMLRLYGI